ncbi:hypothetical protein [Wolbachia endosymbiont of Pentidionis agamae]|uniref:hypothetical protein n=1 Tax=Wolbachia endosymbiont of Pentidionis agamae TaxID=3110435 RepID=UPI002FD6EACB
MRVTRMPSETSTHKDLISEIEKNKNILSQFEDSRSRKITDGICVEAALLLGCIHRVDPILCQEIIQSFDAKNVIFILYT